MMLPDIQVSVPSVHVPLLFSFGAKRSQNSIVKSLAPILTGREALLAVTGILTRSISLMPLP
jgi:hypothetical protein